MFVPSLALGLAGGIWLIVTVPPLLPHPVLSRLMMTLLAVPAVAAAVLAAFASQGFVLETRGEVRSGEVTRVIEHQGKTTSYECVIRYHAVTKAPGTLNCGKSDHVGATVQVAWDPGGLVEPDFAEAKGTYRFFAILAMVSEIALVILGELTVAMGVVLRAAPGRPRPPPLQAVAPTGFPTPHSRGRFRSPASNLGTHGRIAAGHHRAAFIDASMRHGRARRQPRARPWPADVSADEGEPLVGQSVVPEGAQAEVQTVVHHAAGVLVFERLRAVGLVDDRPPLVRQVVAAEGA